VPLDDERIERYSRQLILQEVGPRGQERLLASRVAVVGTDVAAARVVGYLAAAGVGAIAADPVLHAAVDPDQRDCTLGTLPTEPDAVDAVVVSGGTIDATADALSRWRDQAPVRVWIADGNVGAAPPCPRCALAGLEPNEGVAVLAHLRDATLGTVVATEVVKALLAIGTSLVGRVLAYDPATATLESITVSARPDCAC
jgi:molybdopterin/thiamine biosynthesis adenylyltransferase